MRAGAAALFALALMILPAQAQTESENQVPDTETAIISTPPETNAAADTPRVIRVPEPTQRARARARQAPEPPPPELPAAVTDEDIAVTSDYRGFRVTVFGVNPDRRGRGDIVVALRGPNEPTVVRRKRRFLGLWVNGQPVRFEETPVFFAVYSARPLREIAGPQAIAALRLDAAAAARLAGATPADADPSDYRQALVRLRRNAGLFVEDQTGLRMLGNGLFRAQIRIPANAPIGRYSAEVYLFRNGQLVSSQESVVMVSRQGVERTIHDLALGLPILYGLTTILIALGAGWAAAFFFRRS
ncbi:MAG: TIGR02186 family protein [Hyphomonadaceae bacterium]